MTRVTIHYLAAFLTDPDTWLLLAGLAAMAAAFSSPKWRRPRRTYRHWRRHRAWQRGQLCS
jgi:hypothetical protein